MLSFVSKEEGGGVVSIGSEVVIGAGVEGVEDWSVAGEELSKYVIECKSVSGPMEFKS